MSDSNALKAPFEAFLAEFEMAARLVCSIPDDVDFQQLLKIMQDRNPRGQEERKARESLSTGAFEFVLSDIYEKIEKLRSSLNRNRLIPFIDPSIDAPRMHGGRFLVDHLLKIGIDPIEEKIPADASVIQRHIMYNDILFSHVPQEFNSYTWRYHRYHLAAVSFFKAAIEVYAQVNENMSDAGVHATAVRTAYAAVQPLPKPAQ
jgi:hypothetical protein